MKTLLKIMRSTIASLFFLILTASLTIHFAFTLTKLQDARISDLIDRDALLLEVVDKTSLDNPNIQKLADAYIEDYIKYVFYRRSYPSIQTIKMDDLNESEQELAKEVLNEIKLKIDIDYENILTIRGIDSIISNGAIYFLINIGILLLVLILSIILFDFSKAFEILGISGIAAGLVSLIGSSIIIANLRTLLPKDIYRFASTIINDDVTTRIFDQAIIYICIGLILSLSIFLFTKIRHNHTR